MARGINKVTLIGNLGKDPEIRHSSNGSGNTITSITVATSETWKDKQTGEPQERTEWHRVVFFGKLAEIAGEYLKKGSKVYLEGSLRTRKWQDQSGQDRYTTEIVGNEMQLLGARPAVAADDRMVDESQRPAARQPNRPVANAGGGNAAQQMQFDDDIPF